MRFALALGARGACIAAGGGSGVTVGDGNGAAPLPLLCGDGDEGIGTGPSDSTSLSIEPLTSTLRRVGGTAGGGGARRAAIGGIESAVVAVADVAFRAGGNSGGDDNAAIGGVGCNIQIIFVSSSVRSFWGEMRIHIVPEVQQHAQLDEAVAVTTLQQATMLSLSQSPSKAASAA